VTVTVVLSDLHANGRALRRAIELARQGPVDHWVILGDLLTYGADVDETLDLVAGLVEDDGAVLLRGNHDQLYLDLAAGDSSYVASLPGWLRESIELTASRLVVADFARRFPWQDDHVAHDVFYSHANPFPGTDWRYLNTDDELAAAAEQLATRPEPIGVFGHTHRRLAFHWEPTGHRRSRDAVDVAPVAGSPARLILNPGSIGQPRERDATSSFLRLTQRSGATRAEFVTIDYDVEAHLRSLRALPLGAAAIDRLCGFFAPRPA
jgi:predicted phosphodiesterase